MVYFYSYQILRSDNGAIVYRDDDFIDLGCHCMESLESARDVKKDLAKNLLSTFKHAWDYTHTLPYNYDFQVHFVAFNYAGC